MSSSPRKGEELQVVERPRTKPPKKYHVLLYNDDYTHMEFVVQLLEAVFRRSPAEAVSIMLTVHHEGRGIAGTYPRDIAETKVATVHDRAREAGFPLRAGIEEA